MKNNCNGKKTAGIISCLLLIVFLTVTLSACSALKVIFGFDDGSSFVRTNTSVKVDDSSDTSSGASIPDNSELPNKTYIVTFDQNYDGAPAATTKTVEEGAKVSATVPPVRVHYDFKGWYISDAATTEFDFNTPITSSLTLYAGWKEIKYTISFDYNYDGAPAATETTLSDGEKVTAPTDPSRAHYEFVGWFTDANGAIAYDFNSVVNKSITLYAGWQNIKHTVSFDYNYEGAHSPAEVTVNDGESVSAIADPVRAHYIFNGWFTDVDGVTAFNFDSGINGDLILYADWTAVMYTVTFDYNYDGSSEAVTVTKLESESVDIPVTTEREGYIFAGWFTEAEGGSAVSSAVADCNKTYYAHWISAALPVYTITFDFNYTGSTSSAQLVEEGNKANAPTEPVRSHFVFSGWFVDSACLTAFDFENAITANTTIYAKWTALYTVTFNYNYAGASAASEVEVIDGESISKPADPTRNAYEFLGWSTDENKLVAYDFNSAVTDDIVLYACWASTTYQVTFVYNLPDTEPTVVSVNKGEKVAAIEVENKNIVLSGNTEYYGRLSYNYAYAGFLGWCEDEECTSLYDFDSEVTSNVTLYAKFSPTQYTFEAELTDLTGKTGYGYSISYNDAQLIRTDTEERNQGANMGYSVGYLYQEALSVEFVIYSEKAVENVTLTARLSAEFRDIFIAPEKVTIDDETYYGFQFFVNDVALSYDPIALRGAKRVGAIDQRPFTDHEISTTVSLKEGKNEIVLYVDNSFAYESTVYAMAPMVDCIYLTTDADLTWTPKWSNFNEELQEVGD